VSGGAIPRSFRFLMALVSAGALGALVLGLGALGGEEPLPRLYALPPFALEDDAGRPFGPERLSGRVSVVNFIFTSCPTVCPGLTAKMASLQGRFAGTEVQLVSVSVDPKNDTPEVLREYGERFGRDPARWTFVTGELGEVRRAVEEGFRIAMDAPPGAAPVDIVHGEHFVLVDRERVIRGYYRPDEEGLSRLVRDATRLVAGEGG
jgi:protein SCO1/2